MKIQNKKLPKIFALIVLGVLSLFAINNTPGVWADIPNEYIANYEVKDDWDEILGLFVEIEAINSIGQNIPESKFSDLNGLFSSVFPYFPEDYSFKVIYEQCLLTTQALSQQFTYSSYSSFMDNCYNPFNGILSKINSQYTIIAKAKVSPSSGPAPLTVTFDATDSIDPSNDTIPTNNYYRYYKDVDGVNKTIGIGPVLNYTFEEAGNYLVHLTVKSANKEDQGIFDGEETLSVDVAPKSAIITIYANGQKMDTNKAVKIGSQEAELGVVFDATATIPVGGRTIQGYSFEISGKDGFKYSETGEGNPQLFNVILPGKGDFKVTLTTTDNQGNRISESFQLIITDPVAIIKQSPEEGNTSNTFSFDASTSYSVISRIRLFTREIFDQDGEKLDTIQGKEIKQVFDRPGTYTVKLTAEDELARKDLATSQVIVESTEPLAQFSIEPKYDLKYPSEFILDAGLSSDVDQLNGYDELTYSRSFSTPGAVETVTNGGDNEKILVRFNTLGEHTITLTVQDNYGKIATVEKTVNIESTLRPELSVSPNAAVRGTDINFTVKANEPIINYQRNFGDSVTRTIQTNKISHKYSKVGVYKATLKVIASDGMENEIQTLVFIGEKNSPIIHYIVKDKSQTIMTQNDSCTEIVDGETVEHSAYRIDRYDNFTLDTSESVNVKGQSSNLSFYFQPRNDEIYKRSTFNHSFNELGCQYIDVTAEDTEIGKNDKIRVWFKVVNALPVLDNLVLYFPQYGNEMGIGFTENNVKDIFNSQYDPLMVKVQAQDPEDPDGFISYYKRYYYYKDDPTRILETKITPSDIPYAFFSLPRTPGEFMFGVSMYDNDGGRQSSETVIGNGPIVFFPPDVKRPDIPIVTLKTDKISVDVGDEVTFDVVSKIISDRPDFIQDRTIQYDFDGDGERDLTTKKDRVTHIYTEANEDGYNPRAAVVYRGYKGIGVGTNIVVKKGLKPRLLYNQYGTYVIFRDVSLGEIEEKQLCVSLVDCKKSDDYFVNEGIAFDFEYPGTGKFVINMEISDQHANKASKKRVLDLTGVVNTGYLHIQSIPEPQITENNIEFFVGNNLDNSILYNIHFDDPENKLDCYVDTDITVDSDEDGVKDHDIDFLCNELHFESYEPRYDAVIGRIYYQVEEKLLTQDFTVNFIDYDIDLDDETKELYDKIQSLIVTIDTSHEPNEFLKTLLISLKSNIIDQIDLKSTVVAIQDYRATQDIQLTESEEQTLETIVNALSDESVVAAQQLNEYEQAKAEILMILPYNLANDVGQLFTKFESTIGEEITGDADQEVSQQETRKSILNDILSLISAQLGDGVNLRDDQVDPIDMEAIIMPNMCRIMNYYAIPSESCISTELQVVPEDEVPEADRGNSSWVKVVFIILGIIVAAFIGLVVFFAIKAKKAEGEEEFADEAAE